MLLSIPSLQVKVNANSPKIFSTSGIMEPLVTSPMPFSFCSLNIEKRRHISKVIPFLKERGDTFVFLQELQEIDIETIKSELGMGCAFAPMENITARPVFGEPTNRRGVGIFSKIPYSNVSIQYYAGFWDGAPEHTHASEEDTHCVLLSFDVELDGRVATLATTHFMWAANCLPNDAQGITVERIIVALQDKSRVILTGDFNTPRGYAPYSRLAEAFHDNVPAEVMTTIDPHLHRAGALQVVIDGVFSSKDINVSDVNIVSGVSDHCAIVGEIM